MKYLSSLTQTHGAAQKAAQKTAATVATATLLGTAAALGAPAALAQESAQTTTPIKHLVVIFPENISFDHYFATYPKALNPGGEKLQGGGFAASFEAKPNTPKDINTLEHAGLLGEVNPNAIKPFRLQPDQAITCGQNHSYGPEQAATNGGKMDKFEETTSKENCASESENMFDAPGLNMGYYDGNTVTAMWNYAQNYAMSDNSWSTQFGPSTPGAMNLIAGTTFPTIMHDPKTGAQVADTENKELTYFIKDEFGRDVATTIADPDPAFDDCSNNSSSSDNTLASVDAPNIGDLLNKKDVTWGWFQGGFRPTEPATATSKARCGNAHNNVAGSKQTDYNPHHEPFQYFASTANPHHLPPASNDEIGKDGQANHQYDLRDFGTALEAGNLPAVSFLKAGNYEDGHPSYSDPVDEQRFITRQINALQNSPEWDSTAVIIAYDDSDGWYDHTVPKILNGSKEEGVDEAICTDAAQTVGVADDVNGRCGPGTRQPFLVISPYAKANYVSHVQTEQTSVTKFIEDNWELGRLGKGSFDDRAGTINDMFDFSNGGSTPKLFLNQDNGSVATDFASARAPEVPAQNANLKPVADGQNDPKATEPKDVDFKFANADLAALQKAGVYTLPGGAADNSSSATNAQGSDSEGGVPSWVWWLVGIGAVIIVIAAILMNRNNGNKNGDKKASS